MLVRMFHLFIFLLIITAHVIIAQFAQEIPNACDDAPTEAARIICEQLHRWDRQAREKVPTFPKVPMPPGIAGKSRKIATELAPLVVSPYQCMDLDCLCTYLTVGMQSDGICYLRDGSRLKKAYRKEYRMLSDEERRRLHNAVVQLKRSGEYDKFATIHGEAAISGGAHSGPAFLPWHRELLKRFEIALRQIDPSVSIPYWDSTLDDGLPNPEDSVLWTDELLGTTNVHGELVGGDFAHFTTFQNHPKIRRRVGAQGSVFKPSDINWLLRQNQIEDVLSFTAPRQGCLYQPNFNALEYTHGNVHIFVGGEMFDPFTSGNEPTFYFHHAFVDYIWEMYRQLKQTRYERENEYPPDNQACSSAMHFGSVLMRPFEPMRNIDGLSNKYTDNMYEYAPRPTCEHGQSCGSRYLFCDLSHGPPHCVSRVKINGRCNGFVNGEPVCYNGACHRGRCVAAHDIPVVTSTPSLVTTSQHPPIISISNCFNEHECCLTWAQRGECARNPQYMKEWCKVSCNICQPNFNPNIECSDHHRNCKQWARDGECTQNKQWMRENCRKSCHRCKLTRAQVCRGGDDNSDAVIVTTPKPKPEIEENDYCNTPGCYNENICCSLWSLQGQCSRNATWMACNCKVSCGLCIPVHYNYGTCSDYHPKCPRWAEDGECETNAWMLENCRHSCLTCLEPWKLIRRCRNSFRSTFRSRPRFSFSLDYFYHDN